MRKQQVFVIIAMNKMDLKTVNPDRVKQQLQEHEIMVEDWVDLLDVVL